MRVVDLAAFVRDIEIELEAQEASWRGCPAPALLLGLRGSVAALSRAVDQGGPVESEAAHVAAFAGRLVALSAEKSTAQTSPISPNT